MSAGIDYGRGLVNIDYATGIRYGVISSHDVIQAWADSSEAQYGAPHCPKCGNEVQAMASEGGNTLPDEAEDWDNYQAGGCNDYACTACEHYLDSDQVFGDEPIGYTLDDGEYKAEDCLDSDIIITKSPFYTFGPFCSPCVPGAVNLNNAVEVETSIARLESRVINELPRAYCFGHDWFEDHKAPYRVFRVVDDTEVFPEIA